MKLEDVKKIAKERNMPIKNLKKAELIRAIQQDEGNSNCYNTNSSDTCGQISCSWRDDCR